jgi:hypothetical protein
MRTVGSSRTFSLVFKTAITSVLLSLPFALPAAAVIIDSVDGTANTTAPTPEDPGWDNVGTSLSGSLTALYLRNGWILTAAHVGIGDVSLAGVTYTAIPGTETQLDNGDGTFADLVVFGITPTPPLPDLAIRSNTNLPSGDVIMIGNGRDRGAASDSDDPGIWTPAGEPSPAIEGWYWLGSWSRRWGTNEVEDYWTFSVVDTESFYTVFDGPGSSHTSHESQAASGDSGGGLFAKQGNDWELAGVMWAVAEYFPDQISNTSALLGNATLVADLSFYRDDIMTLTASTPVPEPAVALQLIAGAGFLAFVNRKRG